MKKFIFVILLSCVFVFILYNFTYVYGFSQDKSITDIAKEWIEIGKNSKDTPSDFGDTSYWNLLAGVLTGAGIWVIIISGAILGIRFMIVSPEQKAEVKKSLMIWLIGTVVILGALTIWKVLISILDIY